MDPGKGVPDKYNGKTIAIKDCFTTSVTFAAAQDTYIIVAPIPGYAYFTATVATGAQPATFTGVPFPTYASNFGNTSNANVPALDETSGFRYSEYRYASLAAGLYPTSNYMNFAGSVSVWKIDVTLGTGAVSIIPDAVPPATVEALWHNAYGLESITSQAPRDNYTESFIKGAFAIATDKTGDFEWQEFKANGAYYTTRDDTSPNYRVLNAASASTSLPGYGNTETIVIKVSSPTGAVNSAILKVWNCLELKPRSDSNIYQFSGVSPQHDPIALEYYAMVKNRIPVAVCASENAWSWERVYKIITTLSGALSVVPGPIGMVAGGVGAIATGIHNLVM